MSDRSAPLPPASAVVLDDGRTLGFTDFGRPGDLPVLYFHGAIGTPLRRCAKMDEAIPREAPPARGRRAARA
jgi:hypothetical protein